MSPKARLPLITIFLCLAAGIALYLSRRGETETGAVQTVPGSSATNRASAVHSQVARPAENLPSNPSQILTATSSAPAPTRAYSLVAAKPATPFQLGSAEKPPAMEPEVVLDKIRTTIRNYGSMFDGNPVGTNLEITKALNGDNPKQVKFISEDSGLRINADGELVDWWGTPFFFHQLSGTEMEIRSAGPDRIMWTSDDLVAK